MSCLARGRLIDRVLLAALVLFCAVFIAWPIGSFVWQAVAPGSSSAPIADVLAQNARVLSNSAFVGLLTSLLSCALALAVALVLTFGPVRWARVVEALVTVSMISPPSWPPLPTSSSSAAAAW